MVALTGCYTFTPLERGSLAPGTDVRATLSADGAALMSLITGRHAASVEGRLVRLNGHEVVLALPVPRPGGYAQGGVLRQDVPIPAADVLLLERKDLNRARTLVAVTATGAVAGAIIWRAAGGGGGGPDGSGNGGPAFVRIPLGPR